MRGASCALLALRAAAAVPSLDPATYQEPSAEEYWTGDPAAARPFREERVNSSHLDVASFSDRILRGKVLVVEDLGDGPMAKWDCDFFTKDPVFSKADVQMEYSQSDDAHFVSFDSDWTKTRYPSGANDVDGPKFTPFYFGVKSPAKDNRKTWKLSMLKKVQKYVTLPPFMHADNLDELKLTPEFWFAAAGAGAKGHMDVHIQTTMTLQLAGTKRWRLGFMEARKTAFVADLYRDGDIYELFGKGGRWRPLFNVTLRPGQAMFFPPGFIQEDMNTGGEGAPCSASVNYQFGTPLAAKMFRTFLPRVRRTADIHSIWQRLRRWATLYGSKVGNVGMEYADAKAEAMSDEGMGAHFGTVDEDGDGRLSGEELKKKFHEVDDTPGDDENILAFHDLDEDGFVTREEFAAGFGFWAGTLHKVLQETPKKYHKMQLQETRDLHDTPNKLYEKLRKHGLALEAGKLNSVEL